MVDRTTFAAARLWQRFDLSHEGKFRGNRTLDVLPVNIPHHLVNHAASPKPR